VPGKEVGPRQTPDDLAGRPGCDAGHEQRRRGTVNRSSAASGELMQRAIGKTAAGKPLVDATNCKRQDSLGSRHRSFEMLNSISKIGNDWVCAALRHSKPLSKQVFISLRSEYVPYLFLIGM
jgi:hypothetical protein